MIVWDTVNECGLFRLNGHKGSVTHLQFTHDGNYLISRYVGWFIFDLCCRFRDFCFFTVFSSKLGFLRIFTEMDD